MQSSNPFRVAVTVRADAVAHIVNHVFVCLHTRAQMRHVLSAPVWNQGERATGEEKRNDYTGLTPCSGSSSEHSCRSGNEDGTLSFRSCFDSQPCWASVRSLVNSAAASMLLMFQACCVLCVLLVLVTANG